MNRNDTKNTNSHSAHEPKRERADEPPTVAQACAITEADALAMIEDVVPASDMARLRAAVQRDAKCARAVATYRADRSLVRSLPVPEVSPHIIQSAIDVAVGGSVGSWHQIETRTFPALNFDAVKMSSLEQMQPTRAWHERVLIRRFGAIAASVLVVCSLAFGVYSILPTAKTTPPAIGPDAGTNVATRTRTGIERAHAPERTLADTNAIAHRDELETEPSIPSIAPRPTGITIADTHTVPAGLPESSTPPVALPIARAIELARERRLVVLLETHQPDVLADSMVSIVAVQGTSTPAAWSLSMHDASRDLGTLAAIHEADLYIAHRTDPTSLASDHAPRSVTDLQGNTPAAHDPVPLVYTLECALTERALGDAIEQLAHAGLSTPSTAAEQRTQQHRVVFVELPSPMPEQNQPANASTVLWWTAPADQWLADNVWTRVPVIVGDRNATTR